MKNEFNYLSIPNGGIRVAVTNACNMNCFYCHNEGQSKSKKHDLSIGDFKKIVDLASNFGLKSVSITGGEPLLNSDIIEMLRYCIRKEISKIDLCTNGILVNKYINDFKKINGLTLTIGVDNCDLNKISKNSRIGQKFYQIEENLWLLKENQINFSINTVYTGKNSKEAISIIKYCKDSSIELRIIEMDTFKKITDKKITSSFKKFIDRISKKFDLKLDYMQPGKGYFGYHKNGSRINFYNAKCHSRDCLNCSRCHFRIDSFGYALPCYIKNLKFNLLDKNFDISKQNFLKAIYNLGIPPEKESIL